MKNENWKEKHRKFFYELDEYSKRELGLGAHQAFIQSLLEEEYKRGYNQCLRDFGLYLNESQCLYAGV